MHRNNIWIESHKDKQIYQRTQMMCPIADDVPYCLLVSYKNFETFNEPSQRKCPKIQIFDTKSPLIPGLRFFFKILAISLFLLYWPSTSCKISEKANELSLEIFKTDGQTHRQTQGQTDTRTRAITKDPKNGNFHATFLMNSQKPQRSKNEGLPPFSPKYWKNKAASPLYP